VNACTFSVCRYQMGNQNPQAEEGQTTQWPKKKRQRDKQRSTKHYKENERSSNTNPTKTGLKSCASKGSTVPTPIVAPVLWLRLQIMISHE